MNPVMIYFLGIFITLICCFIVVLFLRRKYQIILVELTGNEQRASFWTSFSNVLLILVPLVFAMNVYPEISFDITSQLKWGLIGLIVSLLILGLIMINFIKNAEKNKHYKNDK